MQKYILTALLLIYVILLPSMVVETASLKGFIYGHEPACEYDNWISHLAEKITLPGYNVYSPWDVQTTGFGDFNIPTATELSNWGLVIDAFVAQDWTMVDDLLVMFTFPYEMVQFNDTDSNRTYYMLREMPNNSVDDNGTLDPYDDEIGAFEWGWGLYIYNPSGDARTIITVPHPCDDFIAPTLSYEAFNMWNATYLMITGAGREVKWTNVAPYTNSKSLSDPTRTNNHPFYPAYTKFCNKIRTDTGKKEFSVQIHSYDWTLHQGFANIQISAGNNRNCPNLPIRDLSRLKLDLINQGNYLMIPANTIGSNRDVYLNDYYTVQNSVHPFTYTNADTTFDVNNYLDLPAYSQNVQMNYTLAGWNDYDVFEPFFHAEISELPNCYALNDNNNKWFYGWNATTQRWDMDNLFAHAVQYYSIWMEDMHEVMSAAFTMNDNMAPTNPSNLVAFNQSYDYATLRWQKADDFDFDTYEILYATEPIGLANYSIFSRANDAYLASPYCEQINVTGLSNGTNYYFKIRAKDKNGNYSDLSNQVQILTSPAKITNFKGIGKDNQVLVVWNVTNQQDNLGFKLYRSVDGGEYQLQDSYFSNVNLMSGNSNYQWVDNGVTNGLTYTYKVASVNTSQLEFPNQVTATCYPRDYFTLYVGKDDNSMVDSLSFSVNPNASSGNDGDYDVIKATAPTSNYVYGAFWEQYWGSNGTYLQQEVMDDFNPETDIKTWAIRVRTDQINSPLVFRVDDSFDRYSEKLYLRDNSNGLLVNLEAGAYTFTNADANYKSFTLYWGNLQPVPYISGLPNRVYQGGSNQSFYWSTSYSFLVDHYNLSIQNDTDSLYVISNLPNTITSYSFGFPTDLNMQNARFVLDTWTSDGQWIRNTSAYSFGIVPMSIVIAPEPGLFTRSNIWNNGTFTVPGVFGENALGWMMDATGAWQPSIPFSFGQGYWIQKNSTFEYSSTMPIQQDSISFGLLTGWNLIPNPHLCAYGIEDLRFRVNNITYTFAEMLDQHLISRGIFVCRDGQYVQADVIYPYEAFLIKYYGTIAMTAIVNFIPYYAGPGVQPITPYWVLKLSTGQNGSDTDALEIGSNALSTDDYEFNYDLPEPPNKPTDVQTRLYLYRAHVDTLFMDFNLNSEYRSAFTDDPQEEKIWNFRLELGNTNPVSFIVDTSLFPETYGASIVIGDLNYDIQHGNSFTYIPAGAGVVNGQIVVHNYFTGNEDETMPVISGLKVYPNPFNPEAQIAFSTAAKGTVNVDIYNVKGQHVRSISNGQLGKGTHKFTWNGKDGNDNAVGSGVYLIKVNTQGKTKIIKTMLIK